jgi:glyoxylase-like metal-dependent hydrolase (beta-lactamase superfamily II)
MRIAPGIHRIGSNDIVNSYLLEEAGEVTIIDAGVPAYWGALAKELAEMGRSLADVRAVVLTHGHSDHIGFAERARSEGSLPVQVHEADAALARGEVPNPAKGAGRIRLRPLISFLLFSARQGALRTPTIKEVVTYGDGATLDVPGAPRVTLTPGHTPGSAVLHVPSRDTLFVGDAFCTTAVTTGETGPRIAPFTANTDQALDSLSRLDALEATWVLPGHGAAWTGGVAESVRLVRESAAQA